MEGQGEIWMVDGEGTRAGNLRLGSVSDRMMGGDMGSEGGAGSALDESG